MLPSCFYSYFHECDVLALFLWEEFDRPACLAHALPLYDRLSRAPCKFWCDLNPGLSRRCMHPENFREIYGSTRFFWAKFDNWLLQC